MSAAQQRIHVMHVVLNLDPGGLENGVVNVVNGLDEMQFESTICCLQFKGQFSTRVNARTEILAMGHTTGIDPRLPLRLAGLVHKLKADIVHTRNPEAYLYGFPAAKLGGARAIVHSEHGRNFPEKPLRRWAQRHFSRHTDHIFALSEVLRADLIQHIGIHPDKIGVLYNGVDLEKFRARDPAALRHSLNAGTRIVVGSVGRLVSVKNYALLIEAVYLLRDRFALLLVFVGDGPQRKALEALAFQRCLTASVVFLGHRDDVHELIGGMDIFVLPSLNEGMSNTLIEALATGVPCIASRVGGNPEVIGDQQAGLLFESDNASDLADKIATLCANQGLRYELGQRGQVRAQDAFSLSAMIKNYEGMYKRVLNPSDGAHNATLSS